MPDFNILGILLNQVKYLLKDGVVDSIIFDTFCKGAIFFWVNGLDFVNESHLKLLHLILGDILFEYE